MAEPWVLLSEDDYPCPVLPPARAAGSVLDAYFVHELEGPGKEKQGEGRPVVVQEEAGGEAVTGLHQSVGHRFVVPGRGVSAPGASPGRLPGRHQPVHRGPPRAARRGNPRPGRRHHTSSPGPCTRGPPTQDAGRRLRRRAQLDVGQHAGLTAVLGEDKRHVTAAEVQGDAGVAGGSLARGLEGRERHSGAEAAGRGRRLAHKAQSALQKDEAGRTNHGSCLPGSPDSRASPVRRPSRTP
ncbi:uncharacterized protein LOC125943246 [Dermacentor silvarum]|uniref:uncharacterized protein LOC125943246 n=1 Tax=Dermacentor silvarum TaxID=543639 RepID=UPI002100FE0B|nr:uncharacterized protein LOC125943246 [Dermacentor silvarum]